MGAMVPATDREILQWEVRTWRRTLPLWQRHIPIQRPLRALGVGEREGGLSLWFAGQGIDVWCTDLRPLPEATASLHQRFGMEQRITYGQADVLALPYSDDSFDLVFFKSVIGALGDREAQLKALREMHRVLTPGGVLLFAENAAGSPLHAFFRRRFVRWASYWRYLDWPADRALFAPFHQVITRTTGFMAPFGRSERQRDMLARLDAMLCPLLPAKWHTMVYGVARKAPC